MPRLCCVYHRANASTNAATEHVISSESACCYHNIPLHSAVKEDNVEKLEYLLGQPNVDLNYRYEVTALYLSLQLLRSDSFVIRLLEAGCDPNLTTVNNDAPLHIAVNRLTTKVALKLIEKDADVNAVDAHNRTPLHYAVENNNLESVCMLLYYGANVDLKDMYRKTAIGIAVKYESLEIISVLIGYYDSSVLLLSLPWQEDSFTFVTLKLIFNLVSAGANVNYIESQRYNLLLYSIHDSNNELFKLIWSRFDFLILLESTVPFLSTYSLYCRFPPMQWLECLRLMLESPVASDLIKHSNENGSPVLLTIVDALDERKIESKDAIAIIYLFLSMESRVHEECFRLVYEVYGFQEELEALIYCSSTNLNDYKPVLYAFNFPLIIKPLKEEPSTEDVFKWLVYEIYVSVFDHKTARREIANTLGFFSLPAHMKAHVFRLYERRCNRWRDISKILDEGATFPSLCELSRNQSRRYIKQNFKFEKAYQFYDVLKKLKLPQVIYDIICFKKPIY